MASPRGGENIPVSFHSPRSPRQSRSRRSRGKVLAPLADSSEDEPSPHSSIFEAPLVSDSENEGASLKASPVAGAVNSTESRTGGGSGSPSVTFQHGLTDVEQSRGSPLEGVIGEAITRPDSSSTLSRRNILPIHSLETIVEQKSTSTLSRGLPVLAQEDERSGSELSVEDNEDGEYTQLLPRGRRKKPFARVTSGSGYSDYYDSYDVGEIYDYASPSQPLYQSISALNAGGKGFLSST